MVSIKEAASRAMIFAQDLLGPQTQGIRLEEVDGDADSWFITLSMAATGETLPTLITGKRLYKTFTVNKETGDVIAMRIRELADA